jgi:AcrR family transcriptional regulator
VDEGAALEAAHRRARTDARVVANRQRIARAAQARFHRAGYAATTIADIALDAGCAIQTIYNTVGGKAAVLELVLDMAVAGSQAPAPPRDFLADRAAEATDVETVLVLLADWFVEVHPRFAPVQRAIEEAAAGDPDVAELARRRTRQRFDHYRLAATRIAELGGPGGRTAATDGAAAIWAVGHPRTYDLLVGDLGWSNAEYRRWVLTSLRRQFPTVSPS